jgi:hypothetical protein
MQNPFPPPGGGGGRGGGGEGEGGGGGGVKRTHDTHPIIFQEKETYYSVKRDLLQCQKRPITEISPRKSQAPWVPL